MSASPHFQKLTSRLQNFELSAKTIQGRVHIEERVRLWELNKPIEIFREDMLWELYFQV